MLSARKFPDVDFCHSFRRLFRPGNHGRHGKGHGTIDGMEESGQDTHRQQEVEILGKDGNRIADGENAQHQQHHMLAVEPRKNERHGRPCHRHPKSEQADQKPCMDNGHIVPFGDIGQDADEAHFRVEDAEHARHQNENQQGLVSHHHIHLFWPTAP